MRGAPWGGLFYGFVLEAIVLVGALAYALESDDFLARTVAWALVAGCLVLAVRTVRGAVRRGENPDQPVGRWWFGG